MKDLSAYSTQDEYCQVDYLEKYPTFDTGFT